MTYSKLGTDTQTGERVDLFKLSRLLGLYIIGLQGMGKSGLLEELILQDIKQGIGVGVLDPHGELVDNIIIGRHTECCVKISGNKGGRCVGGICWLDVFLTGIDFKDSQRDRTALKL